MNTNDDLLHLGPHMTSAVTKEEYLWAAQQHMEGCNTCWWKCPENLGCTDCDGADGMSYMCSSGQMFCQEIDRQGWDIKDAPTQKPTGKHG